jgi:hypothetical protein
MMTTRAHRIALALAMAVAAGCGADRSAAMRRDAVLSDARSDGAPGFYFLPPVAPEPASSTANDAGLLPVVEIVAVDTGAVLARFEGDAIRASGPHYMALWSTKRFAPVAGTTYRVSVLLDGETLGSADAAVARNGRALRLLASGEIFGLTGARTVPIKFRIHVEQSQDLCRDVECPAPTQCQGPAACDAATGACLPVSLDPGAPCDDGDPCTTGDACDGEGGCLSGGPLVCADDGCNAPTCDPATGACVNHLVEDGTNCTTDGGAAGYCLYDPDLERSRCRPLEGSGKLAR